MLVTSRTEMTKRIAVKHWNFSRQHRHHVHDNRSRIKLRPMLESPSPSACQILLPLVCIPWQPVCACSVWRVTVQSDRLGFSTSGYNLSKVVIDLPYGRTRMMSNENVSNIKFGIWLISFNTVRRQHVKTPPLLQRLISLAQSVSLTAASIHRWTYKKKTEIPSRP